MNDDVGSVAYDLKHCPCCDCNLQSSEFGVCRSRKDGLNLYCKSCIRDKRNESRKLARERRDNLQAVRGVAPRRPSSEADFSLKPIGIRANGSQPISPDYMDRLTPDERVCEALRRGAHTQKEIAKETKLSKDQIGEALADLLLWTHEVRTETVGSTRLYFLIESTSSLGYLEDDEVDSESLSSSRDIDASFSSLQSLMPGKRSTADQRWLEGWVVA